MRNFAIIVAALFAVIAGRLKAASEAIDLERQFRSDIEFTLRAELPPEKKRDEDVRRWVDEAVANLRQQYPMFLSENPRPEVPTEETLNRAYEALLRVSGETPRTSMWSLYLDRWKAKRLTPNQRIIFHRMLSTLVETKEQRKREYERIRKKPSFRFEVRK